MSRRRRRRRKPLVLEELNWEAWIHGHCWLRTARNEITDRRFRELEALAKDFMAAYPDAVTMAIAEARNRHEDPGLEEVFEVLHPVLKTFAAEHGIELVGFDPSPY